MNNLILCSTTYQNINFRKNDDTEKANSIASWLMAGENIGRASQIVKSDNADDQVREKVSEVMNDYLTVQKNIHESQNLLEHPDITSCFPEGGLAPICGFRKDWQYNGPYSGRDILADEIRLTHTEIGQSLDKFMEKHLPVAGVYDRDTEINIGGGFHMKEDGKILEMDVPTGPRGSVVIVTSSVSHMYRINSRTGREQKEKNNTVYLRSLPNEGVCVYNGETWEQAYAQLDKDMEKQCLCPECDDETRLKANELARYCGNSSLLNKRCAKNVGPLLADFTLDSNKLRLFLGISTEKHIATKTKLKAIETQMEGKILLSKAPTKRQQVFGF